MALAEQTVKPLRGRCGRHNAGPWLPHRAYVIRKAIWYRVWRPGRLYDRFVGREAVYVCPLPPNHPIRVIRAARTVMKPVVWDRVGASVLKPSVKESIRAKFRPVRRTGEMWPVEIPGIERGHLYVLNRYEAL